MIGGDRFDVLKLSLEPAGALDDRSGQLERPCTISRRGAGVQMLENVAVMLDQPL
jgi:hypothetical protein